MCFSSVDLGAKAVKTGGQFLGGDGKFHVFNAITAEVYNGYSKKVEYYEQLGLADDADFYRQQRFIYILNISAIPDRP